jgi:hypothetical protein
VIRVDIDAEIVDQGKPIKILGTRGMKFDLGRDVDLAPLPTFDDNGTHRRAQNRYASAVGQAMRFMPCSCSRQVGRGRRVNLFVFLGSAWLCE